MKLIIDKNYRFANMRAHTATHLLHSQIQIFFPDTRQSGSWVGNNELRFDFTTENMLSSDQITEIEKNINNIINQNLEVSVKEMSYNDAIKTGAKAFFEDKYGDKVRVVSIGKEKKISVELCGGTHISNTGEIGSFVITGQEAVASGIKRISAVVGPKVIDYFHQKIDILNKIQEKISVKSHNQITDKINKIILEKNEKSDKIESLEDNFLNIVFENIESNEKEISGHNFDLVYNVDKNKSLMGIDFKKVVLGAKNKITDQVSLLVKNNGSFAIISNKDGVSAKKIMIELGWKGGGDDKFVQGKR